MSYVTPTLQIDGGHRHIWLHLITFIFSKCYWFRRVSVSCPVSCVLLHSIWTGCQMELKVILWKLIVLTAIGYHAFSQCLCLCAWLNSLILVLFGILIFENFYSFLLVNLVWVDTFSLCLRICAFSETKNLFSSNKFKGHSN
jgi:hypothetical protein